MGKFMAVSLGNLVLGKSGVVAPQTTHAPRAEGAMQGPRKGVVAARPEPWANHCLLARCTPSRVAEIRSTNSLYGTRSPVSCKLGNEGPIPPRHKDRSRSPCRELHLVYRGSKFPDKRSRCVTSFTLEAAARS